MKRIEHAITDCFSTALNNAFGSEFSDKDPLIRPADPRFGDFQANVAMSLGKALKQKPRDIASTIVDAIPGASDESLFSDIQIAGPGFINLTLNKESIEKRLVELLQDERLCIIPHEHECVVVDYSSPNAAKQMHVGHLRSTVIGDALARSLGAVGATVIRQNHLGDWGTQFGMLIENLIDMGWSSSGSAGGNAIADLNTFYQESKKKFDSDSAFQTRARERVVSLQSGDETTIALWKTLIELSLLHMNEVYEQLNVTLTDADVRGESFYNPMLSSVVDELFNQGQARESKGAICVFPEGFTDRDGNPAGLIIRKGDGGFLYATTDLAAIRYRVGELNANRVIYVTDARQKDHFAMVFKAAEQAGWTQQTSLEHVAFGMVLGPDKKPFKTRDGGTVELMSLLQEAEERAYVIVKEKNPDWDDVMLREVARIVGVGSVKYADLSSDRVRDYEFNWDRMLSFDGNTAPYLQYVYVRVQGIFRKGEIKPENISAVFHLNDPREKALALKLLQAPGTIESVAQKLEPHHLCNYLYELAQVYTSFFENCPVLKAEGETRESRLAMCYLTAKVMKRGLELLGIQTPDRM